MGIKFNYFAKREIPVYIFNVGFIVNLTPKKNVGNGYKKSSIYSQILI